MIQAVNVVVSLRRKATLTFLFLLVIWTTGAGVSPVLAADGWSAGHQQALSQAREEKYTQALLLLGQLQAKNPTVAQILFDQAVVLHWAGRDKEATALYETKLCLRKDVPDYVREAIANAYFRQMKYAEARPLYHELAAAADKRGRRARLLEAEVLIRQNDPAGAQKIYQAFLKENAQDVEVYLARGQARLANGDNQKAIEDFEMAQILAVSRNDLAIKSQIEAMLASAYIRSGELNRGLLLLQPYIDKGRADPGMQVDYLKALALKGDMGLMIREAGRLWPDFSQAPLLGLRILGDAYLSNTEYDQAIRVYTTVLQKEPKNELAVLGMAAAHFQKGMVAEAVRLYDQALVMNPQLANIVLDDCLQYMAQGKTWIAQRVFAVVKARVGNKPEFYRQYGERLKYSEFPPQMLSYYKILIGQP